MRSLNTLHQEFEVPEELQDMIKCFWYDKSDFGETEPAPRSLPFTHAAQMSLTLRHLLKFNQKNENLSKSPTLKLNLI